MKKIKLVLIHLIDKFDNHVLHKLATRFENSDWVFNVSNKICDKICDSKWWGEHDCKCDWCKLYQEE